MSRHTEPAHGSDSSRVIPVWDPLVRLIHWTLLIAILLNGLILEPEGNWHHWVGYMAVALVAIRTIWGLLGPRPARFSAFPPRPKAALQHAREFFSETRTLHLSHNPLGALMAYNIWLTILAMGVTGYMMGTVRFFGLDWVEELHELAFNWLLLSIALHLLGVLVETKLSGVSLVKAMLDGRKRIPDGGKVVE